MRVRRIPGWVFLGALGILLSTGSTSAQVAPPPPQPQWWGTITANKVDYAFSDPIWEPHYGAFFSGSYCYNQHYLGPGGDPTTCSNGCIWNWNWWGSNRNVLLCPKCWLYSTLRLFGPIPERWQGSNYQATCWID